MAAADQSSKKPSGADESLRLFLSRTQAWEDPSAVYTFDGERGTARTVICREHSNQPKTRQHTGDISTGEQGRGRQKDCIDLDMYSTQLFAAMQTMSSSLQGVSVYHHRTQHTGRHLFVWHAPPD